MYKLLIVDDEALEREALSYIIQKSNLKISEIREAANGQDSILVASEFNPDIIILDIKMPGLNGIEAGHVLKNMKPDVKIIFVTAYDSFEYAHEAIKIGVKEFIIKPGIDEKTIQIIQSCITELDEELTIKKQKEKIELTMSQITGYLENEFISSVVNGEIEEQEAEDYLHFMLNKFIEGFGVVIKVDFISEDSTNHVHRNMIKKRFAQQLSTLLDKQVSFMLSLVKNSIYILVFGYRNEKKHILQRLIEDKIQMAGEDLKEQLDARLYYGFGESYNQVSLLWKSFAQARAAAKNMLLDLVEDCKINDYERTNLAIKENELCLSILKGNKNDVIEKADYILDYIIFALNDINAIRLKLYEFFILFTRYLNKESRNKHIVPESLFDDLKNIDTRGEAKNYIHNYLFEILDEMKNEENSKSSGLLDKAIEFIEHHFYEGIILEDVANEIGFSTYYFGKIFKKTFNMTFTEYLTNFRIEKAKEYLNKEDLTVKEVTYQVGYMDPNYFTRVFKKYEGLTPTEYRNYKMS